MPRALSKRASEPQLSKLISLQKKVYDFILRHDSLTAHIKTLEERLYNAQQFYEQGQRQLQTKIRLKHVFGASVVARKNLPQGIASTSTLFNNIEEELKADKDLFFANNRSIGRLQQDLSQCSRDMKSLAVAAKRARSCAANIWKRVMVLTEFLVEQHRLEAATISGNDAHQQTVMNLKPILIKDIIIIQPYDPYISGEITNISSRDYVERIIGQIALLAELAYENHKSMCMDNGELVPQFGNNITRLITDEFSFYPKAPLTIKEYTDLLHAVYAIAEKLPLNIHLILASFPVLDAEQQLHNITLHVVSGKQPILHHHSKTRVSPVDITYGHKKFAQSTLAAPSQMARVNLSQELVFSPGTIVIAHTADGAEFITNVEVCLEHQFHTGIFCLNKEMLSAKNAHKIMPMQYSHVLTSRTIDIEPDPHHVRITQADAWCGGIWTRDPNTHEYRKFTPMESIKLNNIFGRASTAHIYTPQPAMLLPGRFFTRASKHNQAIIQENLQSLAPK
jgi:hypothetical protein